MVCNDDMFHSFFSFFSCKDFKMDSRINQVDVDRLQNLWDLIQQTHTLCEVMRTLITSIKCDTVEMSTKSLDMLHDRIHRKGPRP